MAKKRDKLSLFAQTERTPEPDPEDVRAAEGADEALCPCGEEGVGYRCKACGCTKHVSPVNGNVTWMRNGRLVRAFQDEKTAYTEMATKHDIPKERWPQQFQ